MEFIARLTKMDSLEKTRTVINLITDFVTLVALITVLSALLIFIFAWL